MLLPYSSSTPKASFSVAGKVRQTVYNVMDYGVKGDGITNDAAAIQAVITIAQVVGGTVYFPPNVYKVISASRVDVVSYRSGSTFNDSSCVNGDIGSYVLWGNLGRIAKITAVVAGSYFTVDVLPITTTATSATIIVPGFVIPEGVFVSGGGPDFNHQLTAGASTSQICTMINDGGTGVTALIQGANSPAGDSTRYGLSNISIIGNSANMYGLFVGNGAWLINSDNLELSSHGIAGLGLDGNINEHDFRNTVLYGNGSATATTPTGGIVTHPYNAGGSSSCNFYNAFVISNYGFGICDGDVNGSYGVNFWAPQFTGAKASAMTNSGTSMVLQSKGTGDGMATLIGGWSETAANYDIITTGYVTAIGVRMHSSNNYHWLVNGGIANSVGCTFEGAIIATANLTNGGIFTWSATKSIDPSLYSGAPSSVPSVGSSSTIFAALLNVGGPIATALTSKSANYTITAGDSIILASGTTTITLPTAVSITGRQYTIKKKDAGGTNITVATTSAQTIDGAATQILNTQYQSIIVVSDGSNWAVI